MSVEVERFVGKCLYSNNVGVLLVGNLPVCPLNAR